MTKNPLSSRSLWVSLFVPLSAVIGTLTYFSLGHASPWGGIAGRVATGLIGSLVTVLYINRILKRNDEVRWASVKDQVWQRTSRVAVEAATSVRIGLGLNLPESFSGEREKSRLRKLMISFIEDRLIPEIHGIAKMQKGDWDTLYRNLMTASMGADRLLSLFSLQMDPGIVDPLLNLQDSIESALTFYRVFPDVIGVPIAKIKPNNRGEPMGEYFRAEYKYTAEKLAGLLRTCAAILREVEARSETATSPLP